ncbi:MAG: fibronectin type III domain-containing protein [Candidatus Shapirobacteria bacterium]
MMKTGTVKTVLILVILLLVVVLGVLGINTVKTYIGGASADVLPKNVVAKPSDDGKTATISWMSDKSTVGVVEYGTSPAALLLRAPESESVTSHEVVLSPLKSNINYYFRIRVGEEVFDNSGIPYSFKTKNAEVMVVPTIVPAVVAMPTVSAVTECIKGANTMDYINCLRKRPGTSTVVPTVGTGKCSTDVDYNKDGVINTLDRIKCLQNK